MSYRPSYHPSFLALMFTLESTRETLPLNYDEIDPRLASRDYAEVAKNLKVFCVSSKAYQKLSGRFEKEDAMPGFVDLDDTEMPALRKHALNMTQDIRAATCRRFPFTSKLFSRNNT